MPAKCGVREWNYLLHVGPAIQAHAYGHDDETSASLRRDRSAVWLHKLDGASSLYGIRRIPLPGDSTCAQGHCPGRGMTLALIAAWLIESVAATDDV
jgi:hypothetical protein